MMRNILLVIIGKLVLAFSKIFNLGSGSTWPGHIALSVNKNFIKDILKANDNRLKTILIAGTNGKTTTGKLIQNILEEDGKKAFQNTAGANLLNGIASSIVLHSSILCALNYDYAIFEIDENTLPLILKEIDNPDFIIILNLFRDQLDRYGEINTIAKKWKLALDKLTSRTKLILNADDPQIAFLGDSRLDVAYFGINSQKNKNQNFQHASDSTYCPNCSGKLTYNYIYFSHLGDWICKKCNYKHPKKIYTSSPFYPLSGAYNEYNTNAAVLLSEKIGIEKRIINSALRKFQPAFGRQEILNINGKKVQIFLSKNPTSFNESLRTIRDLNAKNILIVLNDRIPDGRDISWIWDIEFEEFVDNFKSIMISGDRAFDMALRIKYANSSENQKSKIKNQKCSEKVKTIENLSEAIGESLKSTAGKEALYILPTYSAMLEVRKILTGKKIL